LSAPISTGATRHPFGARRIDATQRAHDTEAGAEALLGVRPVLDDLLARGSDRRADVGGILANARNGQQSNPLTSAKQPVSPDFSKG
jgi:hypothetical protein